MDSRSLVLRMNFERITGKVIHEGLLLVIVEVIVLIGRFGEIT
jgi:hypothetical protein